MVLPGYLPAVTVGDQASEMPHPPIDQGGTITQPETNGDLDSIAEVQGPVHQHNPFQEVNLFIGEFARVYSLTPMAAVARIQDILQAFFQQTYHAGGGSTIQQGRPPAPPPIQ